MATLTNGGNPRVLLARKRRGLTQALLAKKLVQEDAAGKRVSLFSNDIVRIERFGWIPPANVQQDLARILRTTVTDLFPSLAP